MLDEKYIDMTMELSQRLGDLLDRKIELETELREVEAEEKALSKMMMHLRSITGEISKVDTIAGMGLTTAILCVMLDSKTRLSATEIKERLEKRGFSFSGYKMPMASIYTTLDRLHKTRRIAVEKDGYNRFFKRK